MKPFVSLFLLMVSLLTLTTVLVAWRSVTTSPMMGSLVTNAAYHHPLTIKSWASGGRIYWLVATEADFSLHDLPSDQLQKRHDRFRHPYERRWFLLLGNGLVRKTYFDGATSWHVFVSYWLVLLIAAISPIRWLIRSAHYGWRRREQRIRIRLGRCPACGYDLTANTSGVCPECGKIIEPAIA